MRVFRLILWFIVGLGLGAISVSSFAATLFANGDGLVVRAADGVVRAITDSSGWELEPGTGGGAVARSTRQLTLTGAAQPVTITARRSLSALQLAKSGMTLAKVMGPGLAVVVAGLIWDDIAKRWMKADGDGTEIKVDGAPNCTHTAVNLVMYNAAGDACVRTPSHVHGCSSPYASWQTISYIEDSTQSCGWTAVKQKLATFVPKTSTLRPASDPEIQDAVETGLKTVGDGSTLAKQLRDAGIPVESGETQSSGPSSVQGPSSTSKTQGPSGTSTTTKSTQYDLGYSGDKVDITSKDTESTQNPDGTTTTKTDTKSDQTPQDPSKEPDYSFSDSTLPPVPNLYDPKYPDGLTGVWNEKIGTIKSSSLFSFVNALSSGAPSSGSCPSWTLSLSGIGKLGSYTLQPPCIVWPFVRWALLITAVFVSRRLVFGG